MERWGGYATSSRKEDLVALLDAQAPESDRWKRRNRYYYEAIERIARFHVPEGSSVLEIGCGTGELLHALRPSRGVGVDISPKVVKIARERHLGLTFLVGDAEDLPLSESFDYVVLSDLIGNLGDVQRSFEQLNKVCHPRTRVFITYYNYLWEPVLRVGERLGMKRPQPNQNWLSLKDIQNLLSLAGFQMITMGYKLLLPLRVPLLSSLCNRVLANLPLLRKFCLVEIIVARPAPVAVPEQSLSCTVVVPARNERGNIEAAVRRIPTMGRHTEIVFVEGNSRDGTAEEIERVIAAYPERDVKLVSQGSGIGKGDAVRKGFASRQRRRPDDPRCRPDRAAGGTAEVLQDHRLGPRRVRPRLPAGLPDGKAGHAVPQHPGEQVLQPRVHLAARPAVQGHAVRHEGPLPEGLRADRRWPELLRRLRPLRRFRPDLRRGEARPEDRGDPDPVPGADIRDHPDLPVPPRLAASSHVPLRAAPDQVRVTRCRRTTSGTISRGPPGSTTGGRRSRRTTTSCWRRSTNARPVGVVGPRDRLRHRRADRRRRHLGRHPRKGPREGPPGRPAPFPEIASTSEGVLYYRSKLRSGAYPPL